MSSSIITLPMYDWPEVEAETNLFFQRLKQALSDAGFSAPSARTSEGDLLDIWQSPNLLLGQTCGLPFCTSLKDKVQLVGTPVYDIDNAPGFYSSVIVVRQKASFEKLADLRGATFAYNALHSQSGYAALMHDVISSDTPFNPLQNSLMSGSHRDSVKMVAEGKADYAAIDIASWNLALDHEPLSKNLRILIQTNPTPALPFITAHRPIGEVHKIQRSIANAIKSLDTNTRHRLRLKDFIALTPLDYKIIETRYKKIKTFEKQSKEGNCYGRANGQKKT